MKAILTDYSHWLRAGKLKYMDSVPDKFYRICTDKETESTLYDSCFAIYDVTELDGISSGDGETIVGIKERKSHIYCDSVVFLEDGDDIIDRYIELLHKDGSVFDVREVKEIDMEVLREELKTRSISVKEKIRAITREMVVSGRIVPSDISSDNGSLFKDTEDEILALGSFIYNGGLCMNEYIYKKLGIDRDSVRMFNIVNYEYPLVAICLKGDLVKKEDCPKIMRRIEDCMNTVDCYRLPKEYSYTDIDFMWDDVEFYDEKHDAYFIICHYRPCSDREVGRTVIDCCISEGLFLLKRDREDIEIDLPGDVRYRTGAGMEIIRLISEWLNGKIVIKDTDSDAYVEALIGKTREMLFKISDYRSYDSGDFIYRHRNI